MSLSRRTSVVLFAVLCTAAVLTVGAYGLLTRGADPPGGGHRLPLADAGAATELRRRPHVVFRHTALGADYGRVAIARLDAPDERLVTELSCERLDAGLAGGICLTAARGVVTTYSAEIFDDAHIVRHRIPLPGLPSRVQLAPDGRRAGITVFVSGDSYAAGGFSTRTFIVDTDAGRVLANLEEFTVLREGTPFKAIDFNFWGVTFADSRRFFATLGTGGETYLVEGDVDARQARVLRRGVECPSLSPDATRVVFKKRTAGHARWQLAVLDLETMRETVLAETEGVDDQAVWLDADHVAYALPSPVRPGGADMWIAPADGSGTPRVLVGDAWSPAIVRPDAPAQ